MNMTFNISAANGLNGSYNVTFTKTEGSYTFYNDIPYLTLNVYVPTTQYYIAVVPFSTRSVGLPIVVTIALQVPSPTSFGLITTNNCSSGFSISPSVILIPAQVTSVNYTVTYSGSTVPAACSQTFTISSISTNYYYLQNQVVYYSASLSIDKTAVQSSMILQLSTAYVVSSNVGATIITSSSNIAVLAPSVYTLVASSIGSNYANFTVTTSYNGVLYYAVLAAGTPPSQVSQSAIYSQSLNSGVAYGSSIAARALSGGVNIVTQFSVISLQSQTNYTVAVYLNSTMGNSKIFFSNFSTAKVSNGAAINIAMSAMINVSAYVSALSQVLRISSGRIYVMTGSQLLASQQSSWQASVMNNRYYIYETVIAPNPSDDSQSPLSLLTAFANNANAQATLAQFVPQYIPSYQSQVWEIFNVVPRVRSPIKITTKTYQSVTFSVSFWSQAFVYAVIL
jgi:hypothetical protein